MTLQDISEHDQALLCMTDLRNCCTGEVGFSIGNWFFPNGSRVPSAGKQWDFHRTRGQSVVRLHRRRGGKEGIYHCQVLNAANVYQMIYIGVYNASTGKALCGHHASIFSITERCMHGSSNNTS